MKCKDCIYRTDFQKKEQVAFDTEHHRYEYETLDYCTHHKLLCDDAYLECEYRDITIEARHIRYVINLLNWSSMSTKESVIDYLNKILKGEDLE